MALVIIYPIILLIFLVLSIFFSSADMAYGSVSIKKLEAELEQNPNSKSLQRAIKLTKNYDKAISTILLLNDTVNAGLDAISTLLGVLVAASFMKIEDPNAQQQIGLIFSIVMLVIKIIFGEIIAKSLGKIFNQKLAKHYSLIINIAYFITLPITFLVSGFGNLLTKPIKDNVKEVKIKDDELHEMIDEGEETGVIDEDKAELLRGTIDYASTEIFQIMTPRARIFGVEKNDTVEEIFKNPKTFNYSKIIVYEDNIDNIIGFITTKDLIKLKIENKVESIESIIIPAIYFPRTTEINDVYQYFDNHKRNVAVVIDEYGGTEGIITKEDIVEEIVGEIWDEVDDSTTIIDETSNGDYIVDGGYNLEDFCDYFDLNFDDIDTEYVTIGGFIIELLDDRFANVGDIVEFENLELKVLATGKHHTVKKILVHKKEIVEEE